MINRPLEHQTQKQVKQGNGPLGQTALAQQGVLAVARDVQGIAATLALPSPADCHPPPARRSPPRFHACMPMSQRSRVTSRATSR